MLCTRSPKMGTVWSSSLAHLHLQEGWPSLSTMPGSTSRSSYLNYVCLFHNSCHANSVCHCSKGVIWTISIVFALCHLIYVWHLHYVSCVWTMSLVLCVEFQLWLWCEHVNFLLAYVTEFVMHLCVRMVIQQGMGAILMSQVMRKSSDLFLRMMIAILWTVCFCMLFTMINIAIGLREEN